MYIVYNAVIIACECVIFSFSRPGGHHPNHEDEEEDQQCPAADGAGGDPKEHVSASEEDDQGADRVAHRAQVHKEGRGRHQHLHLHGLGSERGSAFLLCFFTSGLRVALEKPARGERRGTKGCVRRKGEG